MKTFILKISAFVCVILLLSTTSVWTSCRKDHATHGKVTVDSAGIAVNAAKVFLAAPSANGQRTYTGITDASGVASFEIPLPGIWDVTVTKGALYGVGILRLDNEGEKTDIKITVR